MCREQNPAQYIGLDKHTQASSNNGQHKKKPKEKKKQKLKLIFTLKRVWRFLPDWCAGVDVD